MAAYPSSDWLFTTEAGGPSATGGASGSGQKPVPVTWYAFAQALLRFGAHRRGRVGQAGAHRPRALLRVDHAADVRPPVAGDDDRTRLVIDTVLAGLVHGLRTAHPSADHSRRSRPETMPQPSWSPRRSRRSRRSCRAAGRRPSGPRNPWCPRHQRASSPR